MAGIKSILCKAEFDSAVRTHTCRRNAAHTVARGDLRLKIRDGRSWKHYCLACARQILNRDIQTLKDLLAQAETPVKGV